MRIVSIIQIFFFSEKRKLFPWENGDWFTKRLDLTLKSNFRQIEKTQIKAVLCFQKLITFKCKFLNFTWYHHLAASTAELRLGEREAAPAVHVLQEACCYKEALEMSSLVCCSSFHRLGEGQDLCYLKRLTRALISTTIIPIRYRIYSSISRKCPPWLILESPPSAYMISMSCRQTAASVCYIPLGGLSLFQSRASSSVMGCTLTAYHGHSLILVRGMRMRECPW